MGRRKKMIQGHTQVTYRHTDEKKNGRKKIEDNFLSIRKSSIILSEENYYSREIEFSRCLVIQYER